MTHLLGSQYCLDSLSKDVADLHETIEGILRKVGHVECTSWKYPSKNATDLRICELIEDYSYSKDEASNRLSHIIMFELVIDRFCLLLQVVSKLFEQVTNTYDNTRPESKTVTATMSIGLVCKTFWGKLSQFQYNYQKQESELSQCNQSLMDLETSFTELKLQNDKLVRIHGRQSNQNNDSFLEQKPVIRNETPTSNAQVVNTTSTQTFETAFLECEICSKLQSSLIDIGESVLNICETQNLPSSISKHNKILKSCKFSSSIAVKWSMEFKKDMKKVLHCVQDNEGENNTLKKQLQMYNTKNKKVEKEISSISKERDTLEKSEEELQKRCNSLKEQAKSYEQNKDEAKKEIEELKIKNKTLENDLHYSTEELGKNKISVRALEQGINSLSMQLQAKEKEYREVEGIKQQLHDANEKRNFLETQLNNSNRELEKLKSENKVVLKHDQGLQTKQTSLLARLEQLDERCEELQNEVFEMTEEKLKETNENEKLRKEMRKLQEEIEMLQNKSIETRSISKPIESSQYDQDILELSEKLKLVVTYPVLGEHYKSVAEEYISAVDRDNIYVEDEDVVNDMKRQIKANIARIDILKQQNLSLRNSLEKLEETEDKYVEPRDKLVQHENKSNLTAENHSYHRTSKYAPNCLIREERALEPKPPVLPRSNTNSQRPRSGGRRNEDIQSRLDDLERLKNTSYVPSVNNGWTANSSISNVASYTCPDCSKKHISQRDLDIHRPFCFGRL